MVSREFIDKLFAQGYELGLEEMEVHATYGRSLSFRIFKGEIDNYSLSEGGGLSFRTKVGDKMGYSYTEKTDDSSIEMLVRMAMENAKIIDSEDKEELFEGEESYEELNQYKGELEKVDVATKIDWLKQVEQEALALDERVEAVEYCMYGEQTGEVILVNTKGLDLHDKMDLGYAYISVMVKEGDDVKTASDYMMANEYETIEKAPLAKTAVEKALKQLGAAPVPSGKYPVVFEQEAAADMLEAFEGVFSAEAVQKDLSLLKGKLGEKIASDFVSVVDDPYMKDAFNSASFDGEGAKTQYKKLIDKGVLTTFLHNMKTAAKDGVKTTGNASKPSYKSSVGISAYNFYIEEGELSFDELIAPIEKGILLTDLQGMHSGLNPVSGDFSLSTAGYLIENGKVTRPVNQIVVSGNFFTMLKDIDGVANDLTFTMSYSGAPSVRVKALDIAGE